jgi:hypothetical protein
LKASDGIARARRLEATHVAEQRRQDALIDTDERDEEAG